MKLVVGGCSFSDWFPNVEKPWPVSLSEKMGLEHLHEARGCGSNYRIWRELTKHIIEGKINKDDLLFIQYTSPVRYEFWSDREHKIIPITSHQNNTDPFYYNEQLEQREGSIIRWKSGAHEFNFFSEPEKEFFKLLETHFASINFCQEQFVSYQHMFHGFLLSQGFTKFFYLYPYPETIDTRWAGLDRMIIQKEDWLYPEFLADEGHLNDAGVEHITNLIYDRIKDKI